MEKVSTSDRILEVASDLFYTQGYIATGINQIIAEAKVAKASFYHHYPSKEVLCLAYLTRREELSRGRLRSFVEKADSCESKVASFFDYIESALKKNNFRGCGFLNIASEITNMDSEIREIVIQHKNETRQYFLEVIIEQVVPLTDAQALADALYVLYEGAFIGARNFGEIWPVTSARKAAIILLKEAIQEQGNG